ncbi:MAG: flocculation-associated PEP-CTERM protein PepA [Methylotenera sp.]|nr:flocculation-associated PEP-CTERM protein PepA [Methylotenera sp.]
MKHPTTSPRFPFLSQATVAVALVAACASASALPQFTFDPAAAGLLGTNITADNILVSSFMTVSVDPSGNFTQSGYLPITGFQLGGSSFTPAGLNTDYGMYIAFTGSGTISVNDPTTTLNFGNLSSLSYTLYGYNGSASFGVSGATPTETASGEVALAHGSLVSGTVLTVPAGGGGFSPSANATLTLSVDNAGFFMSPSAFYGSVLTAFTSTPSQVEPVAGGFVVRQGGGSLNFAPVPEPSTTAMLMGGLFAVGFLYRRRQGRWLRLAPAP